MSNFLIQNKDIIFLILLILALFLIIILFIKISKLKKELNNIPLYQDNKKVFEKLNFLENFSKTLELNQKENKFNLEKLNQEILNQFNYSFIKYNPYKDMGVGGNQSFSLALINKKGNGFIITSLYSREKNRILLKEIKNFNSEQELTNEEKKILKKVEEKIKKWN